MRQFRDVLVRLVGLKEQRVENERTIDPVTIVTQGGQDSGVLVPTLTILWHPDNRRVGETSPLLLAPGTTCHVTREVPLFTDDAGPPRPLDDPSFSREKSVLDINSIGDALVELRPGPGARHGVRVEGEPLRDARQLGPSELAAGVVVLLGSVACYLSLQRHPRPSAAALLGILGGSDRIRALRVHASNLARLRSPVLLRGESGSGKTVIAAAIHSQCQPGPFHGINMAKTPPDLVAGELFGHEQGSFTGAAKRKDGLFVASHRGTLFLDEIGHTPLSVQHLLLKVLEDGEVYPLGATRPTKVDVRVLVATDAELEAGIAKGTFSHQLLGRLLGSELVIPPIRQRREDIGVLLRHELLEHLGLNGLADRLDPPPSGVHPWLRAEAVAAIAVHAKSFSQNVRMLGIIAQRLVTQSIGHKNAQTQPTLDWLPSQGRIAVPAAAGAAIAPKPRDMTQKEEADLFAACGGIISEFAKKAGLTRSTAHRRVHANPLIPDPSETPA
jgi:two-component system nitrogen regulation response regulator GlnG